MSDYDVMYIDDERNAPFSYGRRPSRRPRPGGSSVMVPPSRRPTVIHSGGGAVPADYGTVPAGYGAVPAGYYPGPMSPMGGYPVNPGYYDPRFAAGLPNPIARFWNLPGGELVELATKALAAVMPLPTAPTAEGDAGLDLENLVEYQRALADHAKRDERLRTIGELIGRILR